jgi:peptidoglycan/LPS O-acetylase OafA/YrhL
MRFIGALGVLLTHVSFQTGQYGDTLRGTFVARLDAGVALFFVLSGFLLSRPFLSRTAHRAPLPHVGFYAWKRILRIVPVYVLTVVLVLTLIPPARGPLWPHWVENLTMTTIYTPGELPQGLTQMWSLATEVAFYTILPGLMLLVARTVCRVSWRPRGVLALASVLVLINIAWLGTIARDGDHAVWLPSFVSWFAAGIALAVASVDLGTSTPDSWSRRIAGLGTMPVACLVAAGALVLIASTPVAGPIANDVPTAAEAITKNLLYAAAALMIILPGVFGSPSSRLLQMLAWAPLRYLGRISYGIFCLHLLVLYGVFAWRDFDYFTGHFMEVLVLTLVGSVAAAATVHAVVESPIARLRLVGRPATEAATTPSTTAIIS